MLSHCYDAFTYLFKRISRLIFEVPYYMSHNSFISAALMTEVTFIAEEIWHGPEASGDHCAQTEHGQHSNQ